MHAIKTRSQRKSWIIRSLVPFSLLLILSFFHHLKLSAENNATNASARVSQAEIIALADSLLLLSQEALRSNKEKAIELAEEARSLLQADVHPELYCQSLTLIIRSHIDLGQFEEAMSNVEELIRQAQAKKDQKNLAEAFHLKGNIVHREGAMDLALIEYHKALEINEQLGAQDALIKQLNNIGLIHREEENYDRAIEFFQRCVEIGTEIGSRERQVLCYGNIGYIYIAQKKYKEALPRILKIISISKELNDQVALSAGYHLLAEIYFNLDRIPEAKTMANQALTIADSLKLPLAIMYTKRVLCDIATSEGKYDLARKHAKEAMARAQATSSLWYYQINLEALLNTEKTAGNYEEALKIQEELFHMRDSISNAQTQEKIEQSTLTYEASRKEQENQLLKLQKRQNQQYFYAALLVLGLALALMYSLYRAYTKKQEYSLNLEQAIKNRTKELEVANKELASFTYITAHDLKEPIRNIVSFSSLLLRNVQQNALEPAKEYASFVNSNAKQLYNLVDDILTFSMIRERKQIGSDGIDLNKLLAEIQNLLRSQIESKSVHVQVDQLPIIKGDSSLLLILFKNFIENAIKYNDKADIQIRIYAEPIGERKKITVEDNGIGIPAEYYGRIFEMFKRLHSRGEYSGSGLGLAICKKIADLHKFEIGVDSTVGTGSRFHVIV